MEGVINMNSEQEDVELKDFIIIGRVRAYNENDMKEQVEQFEEDGFEFDHWYQGGEE